MSTKKDLKSPKKETKKCDTHECSCTEVIDKVKDSISDFSKDMKNRYEKMDDSTKKSVKKGVLGVCGLFAGLSVIKKIFGGKK